MEITKFFSDEDFGFPIGLINSDVINAFKLRIQCFLDPATNSEEALKHTEQDFDQDLSEMITIFSENNREKHTRNDWDHLVHQCLGLKIHHLERIRQSMSTIQDPDNEMQMNNILQSRLNEVNIF
jgi:hypothetical protein